jgi:hypothetical protein
MVASFVFPYMGEHDPEQVERRECRGSCADSLEVLFCVAEIAVRNDAIARPKDSSIEGAMIER